MSSQKKRHKLRRRNKKIGVPPGTLIYTGQSQEKTQLFLLSYNENQIEEKANPHIDSIPANNNQYQVNWMQVVGLRDTSKIEEIGSKFGIHPLVLEDILNVHQRPKVEFYPNYVFLVMRVLSFNMESNSIESEQVSILFLDHWVVTFQEKSSDILNSLIHRIRQGKGIIRKRQEDYLLYTIADSIVDHYFLLIESMEDHLEDIEDRVLSEPAASHANEIQETRRNLIEMRKSIWPLREVLSLLYKTETAVKKETQLYFRDVYDHSIQIMDQVETLRDLTSGLLDIHLSSISNKMNEVMKGLTIIATIFMPLTLITGIYGMNFKFMPELDWKYGYWTVLGVMFGITISMLVYFKRKKWF